jgi:hypothetical protein
MDKNLALLSQRHIYRYEVRTIACRSGIELILKECVRANGKSVYKNPKETITIWGAYDILNALHIVIPERPDLELLHEERNSIQHKYANPSAEDAAFHIGKAMKFIRRFLKHELKVDLKDYVSAEYLDQFP